LVLSTQNPQKHTDKKRKKRKRKQCYQLKIWKNLNLRVESLYFVYQTFNPFSANDQVDVTGLYEGNF